MKFCYIIKYERWYDFEGWVARLRGAEEKRIGYYHMTKWGARRTARRDARERRAVRRAQPQAFYYDVTL